MNNNAFIVILLNLFIGLYSSAVFGSERGTVRYQMHSVIRDIVIKNARMELNGAYGSALGGEILVTLPWLYLGTNSEIAADTVSIIFSFGSRFWFADLETNAFLARKFLYVIQHPAGHDLLIQQVDRGSLPDPEFDQHGGTDEHHNHLRFADQVRILDKTTGMTYELKHLEDLVAALHQR